MTTRLTRRALVAGAGTLAAPALLRAQTGDGLGTATAPISIKMIANDAFAKQWQSLLVPEFNKAFPHIQVTIDGVPYSEQLAKILLDQTGATPTYDVVIADDPWVPQVAATGALFDLKKDLKDLTDASYDWADFNAAPLAAGAWADGQFGVPVRSNMLLMFTNKTLFAKAGLPAPTPKLTWAEFMAQAPKLVQDAKGSGKTDAWGVSTYFTRDALTPTIWQAIMNAHGGKLLDGGKPAFNSDIGAKALQLHIDLLKFAPPGAKAHGFVESLQAFRQGQTATMIQWGSVFKGTAVDKATTTLTPDEVGIQTLPVGTTLPGTHRGIWNGTVSKKTKNPRAAWALVQWMTSKAGETWSANALGVFPARRSTLASTPAADAAWLKPVFATLQASFDAAAAGQMWRVRSTKSDAAQQVLADETARAMAGEASAKDALDSAARKIERLRL